MYSIGLDLGSTATKIIILESNKLVYKKLMPTGWSSAETAQTIREALTSEGWPVDQGTVIATGYGRICVPYSHKTVTEITCHGKGVQYLFGDNATIIDIGGQDTKIIQLHEGQVQDFLMNDKCSAGTGRFLDIMANTLHLSLNELMNLAAEGQQLTISSMCTVFAESEVISLIGAGTPKENIASGIVNSVVEKVLGLASKLPGENYFLSGGLSYFPYFRESLEKALKKPVATHENAQFAGAIGAALLGENLKKGRI